MAEPKSIAGEVEGDYGAVKVQLSGAAAGEAVARPTRGTQVVWGGSGPGFPSGLVAPGDRLPGPMGFWVPGMDPLPLPDGYAMQWLDGCDLMLQLHLHPVH